MSDPFHASNQICPGPRSRRGFMKLGLAGFASLTLPGVLRLRAESEKAKPDTQDKPRKKSRRTSVILVWQPGGCSHLDTYDPKPLAPAEYRGPFGTIPTAVNGLHFTELIPLQAKIADKLNRGIQEELEFLGNFNVKRQSDEHKRGIHRKNRKEHAAGDEELCCLFIKQ